MASDAHSKRGDKPWGPRAQPAEHWQTDEATAAAWLTAIINAADEAIVSKDLNGVIQNWNPGAERLFGYTAAELVGRPVTLLLPAEHLNEEPEMLGRIRRGERIERHETVRRRKDGTLVDVSLSVSPVRNAAGEIIGVSEIARDVSDRRMGDDSARRLAAIVESSDDAIISKNLQGVIQSWNRAAQRLFGYTASEAIGQPVLMLIPEGRRDEEPAILDRLRRGERIERYDTIRRRKDGSLVDVSLTVSPILDRQGRVIGASKIARDISQQKRVLRELQEMHEKALAANRAKDDFLAALSHELRTPLNPVLLIASEASTNEQLPESVRDDFACIRKNVELEARLIDDLLDLSRITNGKLKLTITVHDLRVILRQALKTVGAEARAKRQTLTYDDSAAPLAISGDAARLHQVLWNVLKNAVKFTPENGRIAVTTRINPGRRCAVVEVTDTGIGLQRDQLEDIFDAFGHTESSKRPAHRFGGLGLGLTISKLITELHRGSIHARSEGPGQGATFVIELPLAQIEDGIEGFVGDESAGSDSARGTKIKRCILLVEDHEASRVTLARLLSRRGFEVLTAETLAEARVIVARESIAFAISDIGLPDGDGAELIRELREHHQIPAIALTGYGMEDDIQRCRAAGAVSHLTKPVSIDALQKGLAAPELNRGP